MSLKIQILKLGTGFQPSAPPCQRGSLDGLMCPPQALNALGVVCSLWRLLPVSASLLSQSPWTESSVKMARTGFGWFSAMSHQKKTVTEGILRVQWQ